MRTISLSILGIVGALLLALGTGALAADRFSATVVFSESGFPAADAAAPSARQFSALLPDARFVPAGQLATLLKDPATRLLVLPYGSAFPEASWPEIFAFLQNGGNLLVLGGRPRTQDCHFVDPGLRRHRMVVEHELLHDE